MPEIIGYKETLLKVFLHIFFETRPFGKWSIELNSTQACASKWPHSSLYSWLVPHSEVQWSLGDSEIQAAYMPQQDQGRLISFEILAKMIN
jgi:hypothetical protein